MKKTSGVTIAATTLILIALTGCASGADDAGEERVAPATSETSAPEESAPPLVAEEPAETSKGGAETAYLEFLRDHPRQGTVIPNATDEQRLEAGYKICEMLAQGEEGQDITVIDGEQRNPDSGYYMDSFDMLSAAASAGLCG